MTLCGQTKLQLPHWMQMSGSQTGTNSEMLRFSQAAVPGGIGAVHRHRLTGSSSPRPAIIIGGDLAHELRRLVRHQRRPLEWPFAGSSGTWTSCSCASVSSTASKFLRTTSSPFLP